MCGRKCSRIYRACWHLFRGTGCCHAKPSHPPSRTHAPEDRLFLKVNNYRILITGTNTSQYRLPVLIKLWMLIFFEYLSNRGKNSFLFRYIKKYILVTFFLEIKNIIIVYDLFFAKKLVFRSYLVKGQQINMPESISCSCRCHGWKLFTLNNYD